jgi:3-methyladenine DNA glycosylase AlkD
MTDIIALLRSELKAAADEQTRLSGQRFFKEEVKLYGVKTAAVNKLAARYFKEIKDLPKAAVFELCTRLWESGVQEEIIASCRWSYETRDRYEEKDMDIFYQWITRYVSNWASCDTFCNHTMGAYLEKFPRRSADLKQWAASPNLWLRRAAAVSLIIPARKGLFLKDVFEIAGILLLDKEDMVQKGYGWMLKEAAKADEKAVFEYVMSKKALMPRTSLRYAIEKMPAEMKKKAMEK